MHERHRDKWVDLLILWRINAKPKMSEGIKDLYPTQNFNNQGLFRFKLNLWRLHRRIFNLLHCRHVNAGENDRKRHFPCQGIGKLRAEKQGARRRGLMRKRRGNSPTTPHAQHSAKQRRLGTMQLLLRAGSGKCFECWTSLLSKPSRLRSNFGLRPNVHKSAFLPI